MEVIMIAKRKFFSAKRVTGLAVLLALVIVLQLWGNNIKIGRHRFELCPRAHCLGRRPVRPVGRRLFGTRFRVYHSDVRGNGRGPFYGGAVCRASLPHFGGLSCQRNGGGASGGAAVQTDRKKERVCRRLCRLCRGAVVNTGLFILGALLMSDTLSANFVADGSTVLYF